MSNNLPRPPAAAAPLITCLGEILVDFLPLVGPPSADGPPFRACPGGAPLNVAVGVARLGGRAAFAGKVSRDHFGRWLRAHVEAEGIDPRWLLDDDAPSTLAFVAHTPAGPAFSFYGAGAADTRLLPDDLPSAFFAETAILHFGGISLLRSTTPDAVLAAAERLKRRPAAGAPGPAPSPHDEQHRAGTQGHAPLLSFDPNIRPALVTDEPAYRARLDRAFALADLVKVSLADLAWLFPGRPPAEAAADLLARSAVLVAVTRGEHGSTLYRSGEPIDIPAVPVTVVDTVGAGDAYAAALLVALAERSVTSAMALRALSGANLTAVGRFASIVASLACTRAGADAPRRGEIDRKTEWRLDE